MDFFLDDSDDYESETPAVTTTFSDQSLHLVPAEFIIISSTDAQEIGDASIITPVSGLPDLSGRSAGAMTSVLMDLLDSSNVPRSIQQALVDLHGKFKEKGLSPVPQIGSSRPLDVRTEPFVLSKGNGVKRAVLVGINYIGQKGKLSECHNDVKNMKKYIETVHKFEANNIEVLMDDGNHTEPSRENIMKALKKLVQMSKEGDSVFFHFSGHGGILLPEKNIYKKKNNQFDQTLIPLDHEMKGQIRDFNLFHHFVRPMSEGVTVTCIIDSCHSGSILDLPYHFRADSTSGEMEEDEDTMSNLAFMFTAGGFVLPDMFDGGVKENIEETTRLEIDDIHGIYTNEVLLDGETLTWNTVPYATPVSMGTSDYGEETLVVVGTPANATYLDQCQHLIPAEVRLISGCDNRQTSADVSNISNISGLPDPSGTSGGAMTSVLLDILYASNFPSSFQQTLIELRERLNEDGFSQIPQLSSTRQLDIQETRFEISKGNGVKRAVLVGINYIGQKGQLSGCQNDVKNMKKYIETVHKFEANNIEVLMDDGVNTKPNRENLFRALARLVRVSKEGDSVFFHFSGHGGILLPEKNIYKKKNNQFDQTLIPLDHEMKGQIRDFNLFHHFVRPMSEGVTVTCIIDSCHSGSILDLPYHFRADSTSGEMEEDEDTMSNLAFMFTAGGFVLPDMFDGGVKENIEHTTGQKIDDIHGMHADELNYDNYDYDNFSSASSSTEALVTAQNVRVDGNYFEDDAYDDDSLYGTDYQNATATAIHNTNTRDIGNNQQTRNNEHLHTEDDGSSGCCCCCGGGGQDNVNQDRSADVNAANVPQRQAMQRYDDDDDDDAILILGAPLLASDY